MGHDGTNFETLVNYCKSSGVLGGRWPRIVQYPRDISRESRKRAAVVCISLKFPPVMTWWFLCIVYSHWCSGDVKKGCFVQVILYSLISSLVVTQTEQYLSIDCKLYFPSLTSPLLDCYQNISVWFVAVRHNARNSSQVFRYFFENMLPVQPQCLLLSSPKT